MPRVNLNKQMNMPRYFSEWILIQKNRNHVNNQAIGEVLGITSQAMGKKIKSNQYSLEDFIAITNFFQATPEDLVKLTKV